MEAYIFDFNNVQLISSRFENEIPNSFIYALREKINFISHCPLIDIIPEIR